jgi:hypothetical protein
LKIIYYDEWREIEKQWMILESAEKFRRERERRTKNRSD